MAGKVTAAPRAAATVVLLREADTVGFEVLFVKRHSRSGFMANAYVFPGGRVDDADASEALLGRMEGVDPTRLVDRMHGVADASAGLAHLVAAIRETFEEAFVLLARRPDGSTPDLGDARERERFARWRDRLNAGEVSFEEIVLSEDLGLDGSALGYLDHWITPTFEPRRYDTRFFVTTAPAGQAGVHDGRETTESVWRTPAAALAAHAEGSFFMAPPQWVILQALAEHATIEDVFGFTAATDVPPCQPHGTKGPDGAFVLAMPGDPLHPATDCSESPRRRVALQDGRWVWG